MDTKLVAYTTAYEEFRKIPKAAATISQVLVLPPYQGMGIGSTLLNLLY
jgi:GNAT superfamily N-acetyltransferase